MNCQDFEQIIGDLARRRPVDAGARAEASLLAAFRARAAEAGHTAAPTTPAPTTPAPVQTEAAPAGVLPFARPHADKVWTWKKTLATAATAAAAAAVALAVLIPRQSTTRTAGPAAVAAGTAAAGTATPPAGARLNIRENDARGGSDAQTDENNAVAPRAFGQRQPVRAPVVYASTGGARRPPSPRAVAAAEPEVTTEFFPLAHGGGLASGEGGHIVRVELPRTALASFGLPVNVETAGGRVRADVLLGEDGTARAIRFVR